MRTRYDAPVDRGEDGWCSLDLAARVAGCSPATVRRLRDLGTSPLVSRAPNGCHPTISTASALAFAVWYRDGRVADRPAPGAG
ncbi:hypothetical protein RDV89_09545 [Nocardioides zeae]|uniref:DNA-binding protein n=1 Tax=Nocardioides imazamoxiresistens TaxID=3231893 RepID=A0ABU3PX15_9ACTN|nr:hypothetical protein [Nocardioides zeae]MDT9593310.1 hypothetical protein [Nocardioides zeae]